MNDETPAPHKTNITTSENPIQMISGVLQGWSQEVMRLHQPKALYMRLIDGHFWAFAIQADSFAILALCAVPEKVGASGIRSAIGVVFSEPQSPLETVAAAIARYNLNPFRALLTKDPNELAENPVLAEAYAFFEKRFPSFGSIGLN